MTLAKQLQEVQEDQRSKSLDLREEAITNKETLLNSPELKKQVDVLNKRIAYKQQVYDGLESKSKQQQADYDHLLEIIDSTHLSIDNLKEAYIKKQDILNVNLKNLEARLDIKGSELKQINLDISERKTYRNNQEVEVNDAIAEWNAQITELYNEGKRLQEDKNKISESSLKLEEDKHKIEEEITKLQEKLATLESVYNTNVEQMKTEINTLQKEKQTVIEETKEQKFKNESINKTLESREKSVEIREIATERKELDIKQREERLSMRLNMLGV